MSDHLEFRLVDAFADGPYAGNPAGVVLEADPLDEGQMQAIAREVNASETVFILRANDLHRPTQLRWFTPRAEVGFCGHATLAAAHALHEAGCLDAALSKSDAKIAFESAAGTLELHPESIPGDATALWWLRLPDPAMQPARVNPLKACELLGMNIDDLDPAIPLMRTRDDDLILVIRSWQRLVELRPNFSELASWSEQNGIRGLCVATTATLSASINVQSRFFAPALGINEDPVTGSVHGPLAVLMVVNGLVPTASGRSAVNCIQGEPGGRTGLVRALVESVGEAYNVSIAGRCHTTIRGEIRIPGRSSQ